MFLGVNIGFIGEFDFGTGLCGSSTGSLCMVFVEGLGLRRPGGKKQRGRRPEGLRVWVEKSCSLNP